MSNFATQKKGQANLLLQKFCMKSAERSFLLSTRVLLVSCGKICPQRVKMLWTFYHTIYLAHKQKHQSGPHSSQASRARMDTFIHPRTDSWGVSTLPPPPHDKSSPSPPPIARYKQKISPLSRLFVRCVHPQDAETKTQDLPLKQHDPKQSKCHLPSVTLPGCGTH